MKLNRGKSEYISTNRKTTIKFKDGTQMKATDTATYLGGTLTKNVRVSAEIANRIATTLPVVKKLSNFWSKAKHPLTYRET